MLSDEIVEKLSERLVERMNKTNLFVIKKIAKKIKELDNVIPSNAHDIIQIMEYGGDIDEIIKELAKQTNLSVKDIYDILEGVAKNDLRFAKKYYDYKKRKYIPWEENEVLRNQVDAIARQTIDKFLNLSKTTALGYTIKDRTGKVIFKDISSLYKDLIDEGIVSVSQGKTTLDEEMSRFIKQIGKSGLKTINYESGYSRRLDSAVRMNIQDGIRELHNQTEKILGEQFGADGVEITVHGYPAPDHAEVQGRQFRYDEFDKLQETGIAKDVKGREINLHEREDGKTTLTHRPISEMNCYHYTFPIVVGVSKPEYTDEQLKKIREDNYKGFEYGGKHYTMYEGSQLQRKIETEIRKQKDIQIMGVESGKKNVAEEAQRNIDNLVEGYYELSKASGLPTRLDRIQVEGYKEIPVSDAKTPRVKKEVNVGNVEVVKVSKEDNERLINMWIDYYKSQEHLRPFEEERYNRLLEEKKKGYKDEEIKLDSIDNCNKLLDKINTEIRGDEINNSDFRLVQETANCVYEYSNKSPAILDGLTKGRATIVAEDRTAGVANTMMNKITLNNSYYSDYNEFYKLCKDNTELHDYLSGEKHSWWSEVADGNETKVVITHEFGHRLQSEIYYRSTRKESNPIGYKYWLNKYGEVSEYSGESYIPYESSKKIKRDLIYEPIKRLQAKEGLTQKEIINKYVSMYGRKSYEEMFAEVFANSQLGKSNALGDELIEFLIEIGEWQE